MKQTLIKLSDTHYIVVNDSEIKEGDYKYCPLDDVVKIQKQSGQYYDTQEFKITHSNQPLETKNDEYAWYGGQNKISIKVFDKIKQLSLSEVEEAIYGYSVHNMAVKYCDNHYKKKDWEENYHNYEAGFKAHQELVKDKLFTIEDVKKALHEIDELAYCSALNYSKGQPALNRAQRLEKVIQSLLPKTEWEVEFDEQDKLKLL